MPPTIVFAVTEASDEASAGDYYTALELGRDLQAQTPCRVVFLDKQRNWYDLAGVDVLIVMRDDYDLTEATNRTHGHDHRLGTNWFDRWATCRGSRTTTVWTSSQRGAAHFEAVLSRPVSVIRLATNAKHMRQGTSQPALASDYCFTGSFHGAPREIIYDLQPSGLPFDFALFGHGWEGFSELAAHLRGPVPYARMADVYAGTKLVVDDANSATKAWGSVNSRVFDALAAGALVVTNGAAGAREVFGDLLPSYDNKQELEALLWTYLGDDAAREARVEELRALVEAEHTYAARAAQALRDIQGVAWRRRIGIKIGAPSREERGRWGDYHFARSLAASLSKLGYGVRIDCLDEWNNELGLGDDVVIVLRGLSEYRPRPGQVNLMWLISHPDLVSPAEMLAYDHVFVASSTHAVRLAQDERLSVSPLLQCTDTRVFSVDGEPDGEPLGVEFVGASRSVRRRIVDDALAAGIDFTIYGPDWRGMVPSSKLVDTYLSQPDVANHYRRASAVLNDHWEDMREQGFISNRLFDAAACGAPIVTDPVAGLEGVFGDVVHTYASGDELASVVERAVDTADKTRQARLELARTIVRDHSFDARAQQVADTIESILGVEAPAPPDALPLPPPELRFMGRSDEAFLDVGDDVVSELKDLVGLQPDDDILDIGCGYGRVAHALLRHGHVGRYVGMDILARHVIWCADRLTPVSYGRHTFHRLDVENSRYNPTGSLRPTDVSLDLGPAPNLVIATSLFTHMYPDAIEHYLRETHKFIAPDGRVFATFFLLNESQARMEREGRSAYPMRNRHDDVSRYFDEEDPLHAFACDQAWVESLVRSLGFEVEALELGSWCGRPTQRVYQEHSSCGLAPLTPPADPARASRSSCPALPRVLGTG